MRRFLLFLALALLLHPARPGAADFGPSPLPFGDAGSGSGAGLPGLDLGLKAKPLLRAALVPETPDIAPGIPFRLVLELDHLDGSYSYWKNPGGPGVGISVAWTLPEGFAISPPEWPTPERYKNGHITSYVLKGKAAVVYTVTPPPGLKEGDLFVLAGRLDGQVCTPRSCNPTRLPLKKELRVGPVRDRGAAAPAPDSPLAKALAKLPEPSRGWTFEAERKGDEAVLSMYPGLGANAGLKDVYFFDAALAGPVVDSQRDQVLERDGEVLRLRLPLAKAEGKGVPPDLRLAGVVRAAGGWLADGEGPAGFSLDLPFKGGAGSGAAAAIGRQAGQHVGVILVFAFLGGLLLNVMPCVFPVIGLKIMGFAKQAHKDRRAVFLHGLAYTAGVLICFWTLSFLIITVGRGWGAQLQSDWFLFALCHLFLVMSMNMAGVFEVGAGAAGAGQSLTGREGIKRSFLTGLLATIISTPCSAPFLGTALAYALSLPAFLSLGVFTLMGLGFSFPYLALSLVPGWLKILPKPGPWMETFRQAMSFPLFATTCYLFWTMEAMLDEWRFLMLLLGMVLTAMACWLYGKSQKSAAKSARAGRIWLAAAGLALLGGVWLGLPKAEKLLEWREWSPETVARLREEGRAVYVDFTARWCATCQVNKRIWEDKDLAALMLDKKVALLKADWTLYDDRITNTLRNEFDKAAVPVNVLYVPGEREGRLLPEILTVGDVTEALRALGG